MNTERTRRALALFDELVEFDAAARAPALEKVKAEDPAVHAELLALLDADEGQGPLERPAHSLLGDAEAEETPTRIGPWRVTGVAGRGGMGAVYLGERDDGQFQQRAALKLIRLGMDTPRLRARFLRERQILAALQHPNVATLLDGGLTDSGAPYFAMERVEGQPIDAWCDAKQATLRERVQLFLQVCAAVQHAHQNLIVHRDLKPANIFVDAHGQVKLLDFGIARLLDDGQGEAVTRERPHTPRYAAPEQRAGGVITTSTDVYGLGVVLHELVCGAASREIDEPPTRAAARASADEARARGLASGRALARAVRGDLSAILQQCLHAEPARRYASSGALARDLRAWLDGAPVTAQSPTRRYLFKKFIGRHRWAVAAAVLLGVAIVGGVTGVAWQARKANKAAAEAQAQLGYLQSLLQVLAPSTAEARELDRSRLIAEAARKARSELADKPESLASVEFALGQVAQSVGDVKQAIELCDSAWAKRVALFGEDAVPSAEVLSLAGALRAQLSPPRFDEGAKMVDAALEVLRRRAPSSALFVQALERRALLFGEQEQLEDQARVLGQAAVLCEGPLASDAACEEVWLGQGAFDSRNRRPEQALVSLRRAWTARSTRLGPEHAATLNLASMVAWAQAEGGDLPGGLALADEVYQAYRRIYTQPTETSLRAGLRLSRLAKRSGQPDRALALVDEYVQQARRVFGEHNQNTVLGFSDRASLLFGVGRFDEAAAQFEVVAAEYRALGNEINAALTQSYAADALREAGKAAQALPVETAAVATLRRLYPKGEHVMLARVLTNLALTEGALGQHALALEHHQQAVDMHTKLQEAKSPNAPHARAFLGMTLFLLGRADEGEETLRAALVELAPAKKNAPNLYWEPLALLTRVACAQRARDCEALRQEARGAMELKLAAGTHQRLREALAAP
ncbi:MAG: serine/threonine-protein kinase [Archangium sp.]|nr:serine/threonine-protein kinase [Archangium sp.]